MLVHEVIAAIAISPVFIVALDPSLKLISAFYQIHFDQVHVLDYQQEQLLIFKFFFISLKKIKSCGRFGPESDASTVDKSKSITSVYSGSSFLHQRTYGFVVNIL